MRSRIGTCSPLLTHALPQCFPDPLSRTTQPRQPRQPYALRRWRQSSLARQLHGAPHIPGREAAIRAPALPVESECLWYRHFAQPISEAKAIAHAKVVHREHIRSAELEDEHHFNGPATDTA